MRNMRTAFDVRRQLRDICVKQSLPLQTCGQDTASIRWVGLDKQLLHLQVLRILDYLNFLNGHILKLL